MPRQPRLDAPGLLQHVMARGIERRKLFRDDKDRMSFLNRLAIILKETQTQCYAWALIPNHFHLLLRTGPSASADASRCRAGHSAILGHRQNPLLPKPPKRRSAPRTPSAEGGFSFSFSSGKGKKKEDPINPVDPACPVAPEDGTGVQEKPLAEQTIEDVLLHFGKTKKVAR